MQAFLLAMMYVSDGQLGKLQGTVKLIFPYCLDCFVFRPSDNFQDFNANEPAMWVKISSSWVCLGLYTWTLVAPLVLQDRLFD